MFNPARYENSRTDGIGVLEIVDGDGAGPRLFVPLKRTELRGEVTGPLAALHLTHVYGYTRAQSSQVLEAVYRFPLPGDAAVTGVRVRFGTVEIRATLAERAHAEEDYAAAREEGRQAALLTRESPDVFTLQVAGLQPDQDVTVQTDYVQLARPEGVGWSLRVPLTTAPRYVRSDEVTGRHAHGQPLLLLRDPGHRFALDVTFPGAAEVGSATHGLAVTEESDALRVRLRDGEVLPDRDCVLTWRPRQEDGRPTLEVLLHDASEADQVYFLAQIAPPARHVPGTGVSREVILLVDHSGSMEGAKWAAADWAVQRFLAELTEHDTFALGLFHTTTTWFSPQPVAATARAVDDAVQFLASHRDSGGTELGVALEQALSLPRTRGELARHVLVITDAEVTDGGRILRLASAESARADRRRISVLCVDAAPNAHLAQELAERGGGMARFLTSAPDEEDIATALDAVLADWAEPVLTGLRLGVQRPTVEAAGRDVLAMHHAGWSEIDLGDLPAGRTIWVAGRVPHAEGGSLGVRLTTATGEQIATADVDLAASVAPRPALSALFGARRVAGLEYLVHAGYAEAELAEQLRRLGYAPEQAGSSGTPPRVYAENARADAETALTRLLVDEALAYGLASSETAFVAVRLEAGQKVEASVAVANALPAGWSPQFLAQPSVAYAASAPPRPVFAMASDPTAVPLARRVDLDPMDALRATGSSLVRRVQRTFNTGGAAAPGDTAADMEEVAAPPRPPSTLLFDGVPAFTNGEAVLFDSIRPQNAARVPDAGTIRRLELRFPQGAPDPGQLSPELRLLVFVGDLAAPRASVRLVDLLRQQGERPLNLRQEHGQVLRVVLVDPTGAWASATPSMQVALAW